MAYGSFQSVLDLEVNHYAPLACIEIVRFMIAAGSLMGYELHHIIVQEAFLYATLAANEEVRMRIPMFTTLEPVPGKIPG